MNKLKHKTCFKIRRVDRILIAALLLINLNLLSIGSAKAQAQEVEQLLFNVTKLAQYKQILKDLQMGYQILSVGYNNIKAIAEGNFNLHSLFIDGLLRVNPAIAKYRIVADIVSDQLKLVSRYKSAYKSFQGSGLLRPEELDYLGHVYGNLVDKSLVNLDALATVLTAGKLRMSDQERITEIDRLYRQTHKMLGFLDGLNKDVAELLGGREKEKVDNSSLMDLIKAVD